MSNELTLLLDEYERFSQETLNGNHGKTAQYWLQYTKLVSLYLQLSRSIRTSDLDLYIVTIFEIVAVFFSFDQPNYARWLVKFHDNLINLNKTHPGLKDSLMKGGFSIQRTNKPFSRAPIDLLLEQTINADAGNKLVCLIL